MNIPAISIKNLRKKYPIYTGSSNPRNHTFQEAVINQFRRKTQKRDYVNALDNISLNIFQGEKIGIIGKNGSGKSTLLKILSRVTQPTSGYADIYGRVGSLLEVGTGFHSELSGRENIFLNGAILGMSKLEINSSFDEIVDFSEVEKFLDTPVKKYSSGMMVRLAFSVAAHLRPEILLLDEVLAVGDIEFQRKCLGKIDQISKSGRTILFVSHNLSHIQSLCEKAIFLEKGEMKFFGKVDDSIKKYLASFSKTNFREPIISVPRNNNHGKICKFSNCDILNSKNEKSNSIKYGEDFAVSLNIFSNKYLKNVDVVIRFESPRYSIIANTNSGNQDLFFSFQKDTSRQIIASFSDIKLNPGIYNISIFLVHKGIILDQVNSAADINVLQVFDEDFIPFVNGHGIIATNPKWKELEN